MEPIKLFFSYSHKDEALRDELAEHLANLRRQEKINVWHDRKIPAGGEWRNEIDGHLNSADLILLLISPAFLDSDFCYQDEMQRALDRHEAGEAFVIPIILRPVDWQGSPFEKLQALPKDAKPVSVWANRDEAWLDVAQGLRIAVEKLTATIPRPKPLVCEVKSRPPKRKRPQEPTRPKADSITKSKLQELQQFVREELIHENIALEIQRKIMDRWLEAE